MNNNVLKFFALLMKIDMRNNAAKYKKENKESQLFQVKKRSPKNMK
jgi:hypothetical protein